MTCHGVLSQADAYVDNELSGEQRAAVQSHLTNCARCRAEIAALRGVLDILADAEVPLPDDNYFSESKALILARTVEHQPLEQDLPAPAGPPLSDRGRLVRSILSVAASLSILMAALLIGSAYDQQEVKLIPEEPSMLATGSVAAFLDTGSDRLSSPAERRRLMAGMALLSPPGMLGRLSDIHLQWTVE